MNVITIETPNTVKLQERVRQITEEQKEELRIATELANFNEEAGSCIVKTTDNSLLNHMISWICGLFLGQLILIYFLMRMFHK